MQVKRFRAATLREALQSVRNELGEEAVILKSGSVPRPGLLGSLKGEMIEVVAAVDVPASRLPLSGEKKTPAGHASWGYGMSGGGTGKPDAGTGGGEGPASREGFHELLDDTIRRTVKRPGSKNAGRTPASGTAAGKNERTARNRARTGRVELEELRQRVVKGPEGVSRASDGTGGRTSEKTGPLRKPVPVAGRDERIEDLKAELQELRSLVQSMSVRLKPSGGVTLKEFADMPAPFAGEMMNLMECGISRPAARDLLDHVSTQVPLDRMHDGETIREEIYQAMSGRFRTTGPIRCVKGRTRVVALVGPTGVGKTTTLAKLAANSKFMVNKRVALISADTYRMSAIEPLNTFAGIARLPISAVYSPEELKAALAAQRDKDLIFIDTAGRSPKNDEHMKELITFMNTSQPDEIHLVLPANFKDVDLLDAVRRFSVLTLRSLLFTKVDETGNLGAMYNIAVETGLPVSYVTNGQTIPDDIELANPQNLARMIMRTS